MEQVWHHTVKVWLWTDVSSDWTVSVWRNDLTGSSWMQNNEERCSWIHSDSSSAFPVEIIRLSPSGVSDRLGASSVFLLLLLTDGNSFEHDEEHFDGRFLISLPNFKIASVRLWRQWRNRKISVHTVYCRSEEVLILLWSNEVLISKCSYKHMSTHLYNKYIIFDVCWCINVFITVLELVNELNWSRLNQTEPDWTRLKRTEPDWSELVYTVIFSSIYLLSISFDSCCYVFL